MWMVVSPVVLTIVIILKWIEYKPMEFDTGPRDEDKYLYPPAVQVTNNIMITVDNNMNVRCWAGCLNCLLQYSLWSTQSGSFTGQR